MKYKELTEKQQLYINNINKVNVDVIENHNKAFEIEFAHNSTAIEGNTLTLVETKLLLEDAYSIGGKKLREIYEVINHQNAFNYVKECVSKNIELNEEILKNIHEILNQNIFIGGIYRNEPVRITGASHKPPTGQKMYEEIQNFYMELKEKENMHPIELAAWTHAEFVRIHPFIDGNGRCARLIMNYQLMSHGYPPISISVKDKLDYYRCLDAYGSDSTIHLFNELIADIVSQRLDEYIEIIESMNYTSQDFEQEMN